jgi:FkbM family methyltransferase
LLRIVAPRNLYVPKVLEPTGLAGHDAPTLACFLAAAELMPIGAIFDIGSNVGVFSLLATALTHHRVVAFEPSPDVAAVARSIAARNGLEPIVEQLALGATDGSATLFLSPTDSSNSLLAGFRPAKGDVTVTVERLDSYCERTGVVPGLLKIDTEATEPDVLRGASHLLESTRPWMICEVLAGRTEAELTALLRPLGYAWYRIAADVPLRPRSTIEGDPTYAEMNWLFAPEPPSRLFWERMTAWQRALAECGPTDP